MKLGQQEWEPVAEIEPSERFASTYGGNFAKELEINRVALGRFLKIAALDGRLLLREGHSDRFRVAPDLNPDGSVTGKGRLRWGEKVPATFKDNDRIWRVEQNQAGWDIAINDGLISEKLAERKKGNVREIKKDFSRVMDRAVKGGLRESLLRDKCTFAGDPFFAGRLIMSAVILLNYYSLSRRSLEGNLDPVAVTVAIVNLFGMGYSNLMDTAYRDRIFRLVKKNKNSSEAYPKRLFTYDRRSGNSLVERLSIPFEIDRLVRGFGYLAWLDCKKNSLVRVHRD